MALDGEIEAARKNIVTTGYEMSIGEIANLYKDDELRINPNYQRLFRWDDYRKTRFIESIILGIPLPPIFVFTDRGGNWELIDGLQRLSTIFQFMGVLKNAPPNASMPLILGATPSLPSLQNKSWSYSDGQIEEISPAIKTSIKRARIRVEILDQGSDPLSKFELFERLNSGGANLTPQEIRNATAIMIEPRFFDMLARVVDHSTFRRVVPLTAAKIEQQFHMEIALRLFAYPIIPYESKWDVHPYLENALKALCTTKFQDAILHESKVYQLLALLDSVMGENAFRRYNEEFQGGFSISAFDAISYGLVMNLEKVLSLQEPIEFVKSKVQALWDQSTFISNSGAGVRGTTRFQKLLPWAQVFFNPDFGYENQNS